MILSQIFNIRLNPTLINKDKSKKLGQYFTSIKIAKYMANMISSEEVSSLDKQVRILDAGAGEGILAISAVLECVSLGFKNIHLTLYEVDPDLIMHLQKQIEMLYTLKQLKTIHFEFEILNLDFILNRPDKNKNFLPFDICIINPPYFKYSVQKSPYSKATADLFKGDPNIYASFMATCISYLKEDGQLIAITPRSFTNGLYFKGLRHYLSAVSSLDRIHIFKSRNKLFKDSSVLQENIIFKLTKKQQSQNILIIASDSDKDIENGKMKSYDSSFIFDKTNELRIIHIPENENDALIMQQANTLKSNFSDSGYHISTGPVVEHRTRKYIVESINIKENIVPLLRPHNVRLMNTVWSGKHKKDVMFISSQDSDKHLLANKTYVLLKRFSSKDEKKRLTAGVYTPVGKSRVIGFGNKLNYISLKDSAFEADEAFGLAAVLNSTFMDSYFRCFSGNTQVNATEIRIMKFPTRNIICQIGRELVKKNITQGIIDKIVMENLFSSKEIDK